jgi:hypothetical protein
MGSDSRSLDRARVRADGEAVRWIHDTATSLPPSAFDCVVMTAYWVRDVQSGPPLGPSRSKGSEAGCRLSSGSSIRSKCPPPRFLRGGRAARRRWSVPNGDSRRVGVAESSPSTRARRGSVDVLVVIFWGTFSVANGGRSRQMSDRSASLRRCFTTASGRESFPRSAGSRIS